MILRYLGRLKNTMKRFTRGQKEYTPTVRGQKGVAMMWEEGSQKRRGTNGHYSLGRKHGPVLIQISPLPN